MSLARRITTIVTGAAAVLALTVTPALANRGHNGMRYVFRGTVTTAPAAAGGQLGVQITGGNRPALKALIGSAQPTAFLVDATTQVLVETNAPTVGTLDQLAVGDDIRVVYVDHRGATLAELAAKPAKRVWDLTASTRPAGREFMFAGTAVSTDAQSTKITLDVDFGNWRALYSMLGQTQRQTFSYNASTSFIKWVNGAPTTVDPSAVTAGQRITIRVIAPDYKTSLATLEATPAWRVKLGEPLAELERQNDGR